MAETVFKKIGLLDLVEQVENQALTASGWKAQWQLLSEFDGIVWAQLDRLGTQELETIDRYTAHWMELRRDQSRLPSLLPPLTPLEQFLERGTSSLNGEEVIAFRALAIGFNSLATALSRWEEKHSLRFPLFVNYDKDFDHVAHFLSDHFDVDGEVIPDSIPAIRTLRRKLEDLNRKLLSTAASEMKKLGDKAATDAAALRRGRVTLAVRSDKSANFNGVLSDVSASGAVRYYESSALVDLNNQLVEGELKIQGEIEKQYKIAASMVRDHWDSIEEYYKELLAWEPVNLRAAFGLLYGAAYRRPNFDPALHLEQGINPLLGQSPVPLDIQLEKETRGVIISGPNAGGKSVALKTIGLHCAAASLRFPLNNGASTTVPQLAQLAILMGDEQSIEDGLSSFSAAMVHLRDIMDHSGPGSMVLLDEMSRGTDPKEGIALATAVFEHLEACGALFFASTHYNQLKALPLLIDSLKNGSMELDERSLEPTYRFKLNVPGKSYGLTLAERAGVNGTLLARARNLAENSEDKSGQMLHNLIQLEHELSESRSRLEAERALLAQSKGELDQRQERLERWEQQLSQEKIESLDRELATIRARAEAAFQKAAIGGGRTNLHREVQSDIRQSTEALKLLKPKKKKRPQPMKAQGFNGTDPIEVGDRIKVANLDSTLEVISINGKKNELTVIQGALKLRKKLSDVTEHFPQTSLKSGVKKHLSKVEAPAAESKSRRFQLDLRGMRVDEAEREIESQLDACVLSGQSHISILHGTGTGALQKLVQSMAKKSPYVVSFAYAPPEEGGFGKTYLELKG